MKADSACTVAWSADPVHRCGHQGTSPVLQELRPLSPRAPTLGGRLRACCGERGPALVWEGWLLLWYFLGGAFEPRFTIML